MKGIQGLPIDVFAIPGVAGVNLTLRDMGGKTSCRLSRIREGEWSLVVNSARHLYRQRYAVAHALGHFFLHRTICESFDDDIYFRGGGCCEMDDAANLFAKETLMPEKDFKRAVADGTRRVRLLSKLFSVSSLAVRVRAKDLGFSGHGM